MEPSDGSVPSNRWSKGVTWSDYLANVNSPVESWVEYYSQEFVAVDSGDVMGGNGAIGADYVDVEGDEAMSWGVLAKSITANLESSKGELPLWPLETTVGSLHHVFQDDMSII